MKIQVAIDLLSTAEALELAGKVAPYVDIIELGTPLIKAEGLSVITAIKQAHPDKTVFADMKTMDAGELEADIALAAGADLVSILGAADNSTIAGAVKAATERGKGIVVDLIGIADKPARAREVAALGVQFVEFHAGLDEQAQPGYDLDVPASNLSTGTSLAEKKEGRGTPGLFVSVAARCHSESAAEMLPKFQSTDDRMIP